MINENLTQAKCQNSTTKALKSLAGVKSPAMEKKLFFRIELEPKVVAFLAILLLFLQDSVGIPFICAFPA
jgi:hypothetical protein